jgi:hypothetical protein
MTSVLVTILALWSITNAPPASLGTASDQGFVPSRGFPGPFGAIKETK